MSRVLLCIDCEESVEVFELPAEWLDPDRYLCGRCAQGRAEAKRENADREARGVQLELVGERSETPAYDPTQARIPY
jgi:hypothetical protein